MTTEISRETMLSWPTRKRLEFFASKFALHRNLEGVMGAISELMDPISKARTITLIGPTGVGKSMLGTKIAEAIVRHYHGAPSASDIQCIYVEAQSDKGIKTYDWGGLYSSILRGGLEVDVERKVEYIQKGGELVIGSVGTIPAKKFACGEMAKHRNTKLVTIDEAAHILVSSDYKSTMNTLKSLSQLMKSSKVLLIGPYDLLNLLKLEGQVRRRSPIVHFKRYSSKKKGDIAEFGRVLSEFLSFWPCADVPPLMQYVQQLMESSCGCIGILKDMLDQAAIIQTRQRGEGWNEKILSRVLSPLGLQMLLEQEASSGEHRLKGQAYYE
jgi:hypothetical protein